jgi:hypothetical protein
MFVVRCSEPTVDFGFVCHPEPQARDLLLISAKAKSRSLTCLRQVRDDGVFVVR